MNWCRRQWLQVYSTSHCSAALVACAFVSFGNLGAGMSAAAASDSDVAALQDASAPRPVGNTGPSSERSDKPSSPATNSLRTIPLDALSQTLARPLFSPSRRPPAIVVSPVLPPTPAPAPPMQPDHPLLTLLGTIIGESDAVAVLLDQESQDIIRLKPGQVRGGWTLRAIRRDAAIFGQEHQEAVLALRRSDQDQSAPGAGVSRPVVPAAARAAGAARKARREL